MKAMTDLQAVRDICDRVGNSPARLMDILRDVQGKFHHVSNEAADAIAAAVGIPRVEVESTVSFYAFFSTEPKGEITIRLSNDIIDKMKGADAVAEALADELGVGFGETTPDGKFTIEWTPCIGMCDQAPAALVGNVVVTELTPDKAREMVRELRKHGDPKKLVKTPGDGNNAHPLVGAMVKNNIKKAGPMVLSPCNRGEAIRKALGMTPAEVIRALKTARLRGRGGAGFPCGMKWEFTRAAEGDKKYVVCNADEGEPGTFKDRVLLTEKADRIFAGMTIAGYAIGAKEGIMYLRAEYAYLQDFLEEVLQKRRVDGWIGKNINGKEGFSFDISIQIGAGAYVCGEETSLLSSCEGLRGDPKNRPPFPAQKGYLGCPTSVNNVETLCCVTKILEEGPATFSELGTEQSSGTKLLSISGDVEKPGVYEVELGTKLHEVLKLAGAKNPLAVQVGGPSGQMVGVAKFDQPICFDQLATGGSIMVFNTDRDVVEIAHAFMEFFVEESCGYCTPCRVGNVLLKNTLDTILEGRGDPADLNEMLEIGRTMKATSRCGLGQTSWRPVATSIESFREAYDAKVHPDADNFQRSFNLKEAVAVAESITGRTLEEQHS